MIAYIVTAFTVTIVILAPAAVTAGALLLYFHLKDKGWW